MVAKYLFEFFSEYGLPRKIQSDRGSNFLSHVFQQAMPHPESQEARSCDAGECKNLLQCVQDLKLHIEESLDVASENLKLAQGRMKLMFARKGEIFQYW